MRKNSPRVLRSCLLLDGAVPLVAVETGGSSVGNLALVELAVGKIDAMEDVGAPALGAAELDAGGHGVDVVVSLLGTGGVVVCPWLVLQMSDLVR